MIYVITGTFILFAKCLLSNVYCNIVRCTNQGINHSYIPYTDIPISY